MSEGQRPGGRYSPVLRLALVSFLMCGLVFPLIVTGAAQLLFPSQANGGIVQLNGGNVGSQLIAQNFSQAIFFHPRSGSASGVDPDITLQDAYSQIPRISNATGISVTALTTVVNQTLEGSLGPFGDPYVNVLRINLALINQFPQAYGAFRLS